MTKRKSIPVSVKREVLTEAGYRCAVPTCRTILAIDLHHLDPIAEDGGNTASNLLALCPNCHSLYHRKVIHAEALRVWKGMLVSLNEGIGREAKELLLLLAMPPQQRPQWFTSDGVIRFAPMVVAGLVKIVIGPPLAVGGSWMGASPWPGAYYVELTEKGVAVVEAWKAGNTDALEIAQRH